MVKLLESRGVAFEYPGSIRAVDGVDLAFEAGELLAVIGPNGSGKTTLLKLFAGLLRPARGEVFLDSAHLDTIPARERARRIAVVPQFLRSLPDITVEDFVLGGRYGHLGVWKQETPHDREVVAQALEDADIGELADRLLLQLSGGQRQRVLIARALAQEAEVLLVDEPSNSLDPEHQIRVFELLFNLTREGRGALVVTHDLNLASQFATRIAVLSEGRVLLTGTAAEILRREVLEPVYGSNLRYGTFPGNDEHPFVLPWIEGGAGG
jgi:iron complex transport system ATP-binding protein